MTNSRWRIAVAVAALLAGSSPSAAQTIASADLRISGTGLRVIDSAVSTSIDIPVTIQTEFGGKQNDAAPAVEGLLAVGELTGPAIETPIRLETTPGHKFQVPGLSREGTYFLQNIRLVNGSRELLQPATPSLATITVANVFETRVRVRQLSPEELRARGISIDARNQTAYEYVFTFLVNGQLIEVPYPVVVDNRTHEVTPITAENPYNLPSVDAPKPPRWSPPQTVAVELAEEIPTPHGPEQLDTPAPPRRPSIPAAIVIPNDIAVLHQFFLIGLVVTNNATAGDVTLESITALMKPPVALRLVRSDPAVSSGRPLTVVDAATGVSFLVAQAQGEAEWVMEGLKPGTHTVEIELRATLKSAGQQDVPLRGVATAAVHVHDPRFNIIFSHPETVRKGLDYSTFSFISNLSGASQTIRVSSGVPACSASPGSNVCRVDGTADSHELTIPSGEMRMIEYRLRSGLTGRVFATAGDVGGDAITASVELRMGVSESGIPLSPTTLILPHYSRYLDQQFVSSYLSLLGLGYSLATAPMTQATARMPRVIRSDVFQRAVEIARAGQRVFLGEPMFDSLANLSLDLLGNSVELPEWDELRRRERTGRTAGAALTRQLEASGLASGATFGNLVDRFAEATAHREGYLLALGHAAGVPLPDGGIAASLSLQVRAPTSGRRLSGTNESSGAAVRDLPFGDLSAISLPDKSRAGEIALVGRWTEDLELVVIPNADGLFTLDLVYPGTSVGSLLRATVEVSGKKDQALRVPLTRGDPSVRVLDGLAAAVAITSALPLAAPPLRIVGARQDLFLDKEGHRVSVLFNRPVGIPEGADLLQRFRGEITLNRDGLDYRGNRPISGAALQEEKRIVNLSFDHALHQNASYTLAVGSLLDPISNLEVTFGPPVTPLIDDNRAAGIVYGRVLTAEGKAIPDAQVTLTNGSVQYDIARTPDGTFLFESVPRDPESGVSGAYRLQAIASDGKHSSIAGAVRLPGRVQFVDLVFLGRGRAEGYVRYSDGQKVANATVVVGSTMFGQSRQTITNASGFYRVEDLPVGPLTFSAADGSGSVGFAADEIKTAGQLLSRDISIVRRAFPASGTIRGRVVRSDNGAAVAGARVGAFAQGYAVAETTSDSQGRFEFARVPAGFVSILAAEWSLARESASLDFDLAADEIRDITLTLKINPADPLVSIQGDVVREDPLFPGDATRYQRVAGAMLKIDGGQVTTADPNGHYLFESIPASFVGRWLRAYDPVSKRSAAVILPTLDPSATNNVPVLIRAQDGFGTGTVRVRLLSAAGFPVSGYRVIEPGTLPVPFTGVDAGVYELKNVAVGRELTVVAVPIDATGALGDQTATGRIRVEFNGHIASLTLRLAGQGMVRAKLTADIDLIGDVELSYPAWDEAQQAPARKSRFASTAQNGQAGYAVFEKVPAGAFTATSAHPVYGYGSQDGRLGFDGDVASVTLQLAKLASVRGRVYAIDGVTPIAGATVRIDDGRQNQGSVTTGADGSFAFHNVAAGASFTVVAEKTESGVYRTGIASGRTPDLGGPLEDVAVVMRRQGSINARVVYASYKVFDPVDPSKNVVDDTPGTLADNAPVPLALVQTRELDFPARAFGTSTEPLTADAGGRFTLSNLFEGAFRISAADPGNPELRGEFISAIRFEGETLSPIIGIGEGGVGSATIRVVDPNRNSEPVASADVTLSRAGAAFDIGTTNSGGAVRFDNLPVGSYSASAYSKALGRSGNAAAFSVTLDGNIEAFIALEFSGGIDGRVSDPERAGAGVAGAQVSLSAFAYQTRATASSDGNFSFEGVREGEFRLEARDSDSPRRATSSGILSQGSPRPFIALELEPTATLHLAVYLPNDAGGDSNVLAPLVSVELRQGCRFVDGLKFCEVIRRAQGNSFQFANLLARSSWEIDVAEVGGEERKISLSGSFPKGSASDPVRVVLPAFGSLEVHVQQGGAPAANATVMAFSAGTQALAFTDGAGVATLRGVALGDVSVQATSFDSRFTASTNTRLASQSTPVLVTLTLGSYATLAGYVDAEAGEPSTGTRVVAFTDQRLETMTDSNGRFQMTGIPTSASGTRVELTYFGPDDITIGARQMVMVGNDSAGKLVEVPRVRVDATPPTLLSFFPTDGAQSVSPDITLRFVFSEPIATQFLTNSYFQLVPADGTSAVNTAFATSTAQDGTFVVMMIPPAPPAGQRFPLKSNMLYRVVVSGEITDLTGHRLPGTRGGSFTTTDYAEPRVIRVIPSPSLPLQPSTTFEIRFNEPIDPAPWQPGGAGQIRLYRTDRSDQNGQIVAEKPGRGYLDPNNLSLFFAPNDLIEEQSFFRLVFSGVRDLQGNALGEQALHFFSYDRVKPVATLVSPVPEGFPLVSGVEYALNIGLKNPDGTPAADVESVDYVRVSGEIETFLFTANKAPFAYKFVAPEGAQTLTIRARARDLSGNISDPATMSWNVVPNLAPQKVSVALTPSALVYPGSRVGAAVTFEDEGVLVTVQVKLDATQSDGSPYTTSQTRQVGRATVADPWPAASLDFDLPPALKAETRATFTATVTDVRGQQGSGSAGIDLAKDALPPQLTISSPVADQLFEEGIGKTIPIIVTAVDAEVAVKEVVAQVERGGQAVLTRGAGNEFTGVVPVPSLDETEIVTRTVTVTARDYEANAANASVNIRIQPLYDPDAPVVRWTCSSRGVMYPAGYTAKLRIFALGNDKGNTANGVQTVEFFVGSSTTALAGSPVTGQPNHWEITYSVPADAAAESLIALRAVVKNVAGITTEATSSILVVTGRTITTNTTIAEADTSYDGQTVVVQSGTTTVVGAHQFDRLVILDGARLTHEPTNSGTIHRLNVTANSVYVSCSGAIDVSYRGFAGYNSGQAFTWPNISSGGSKGGAGGSHGGSGGIWDTSLGTAAKPYGSVFDPGTPGGAGGHTREETCANCQPGGGIVRLRATNLTLDGAILSGGAGGVYDSFYNVGVGGGAGGSIRLDVDTLSGGGEMHADGGGSGTAGGGGGRVAIYYKTLGIDRARITAAGGDCASDNRRGAAGTIFLKSAAELYGELIVDNLGRLTQRVTSLTSVGIRTVDAFGTDFVKSTSAQFPSPDLLRGIRLVLNGDRTTTWPIVGNDAEQIRVDVSAAALAAQAGQQLRGLYRLDRLRLRNANLEVEDLLQVGAAIDKDASSTLVPGNEAAPLVTLSLISVSQSAFGSTAIGRAGAVQDPDKPVTVLITNSRTSQTSAGTAASDGSFAITVPGQAGDRVSMKARDGHRFALESASVELGTLPADGIAPIQIDKGGWNVDGPFSARTLALEGNHLVIASQIWDGAGGSNRLVIYDVTTSGAPQHRTTLSLTNSYIRDVDIRNGWAYVVGTGGFRTVNLNAALPAESLPDLGMSYGGSAVAVDGTHAFLPEDGPNGGFHVYEVTDPQLPRRVFERQGITPFFADLTGVYFRGSGYLVGTTWKKTNSGTLGHDVMVIDWRDLNSPRLIADVDIPDFDGYRGRVVGTTFYLAGVGGAFAVVDLSNPESPLVLSVSRLGAAARGLEIVGSDALIAASNLGMQNFDVSTATAPVFRGSLGVGGVGWDVEVKGLHAYVANETGLVVAPIDVAPQINATFVKTTTDGASTATVAGAALSVLGDAPLTADLENPASGLTTTGVNVATDGSFSGSASGKPGEQLRLRAVDRKGRAATRSIGPVPFANETYRYNAGPQQANNDSSFRARRLAVDGSLVGVTTRSFASNDLLSNYQLLFTLPNASATPVIQSVLAGANPGIQDLAMFDGWSFLASGNFATVDSSTLTVSFAADQPGNETAVVRSGSLAFVASDYGNDGRLRVYDVTNPASPTLQSEKSLMPGVVFRKLLLLGANHLIAVAPEKDLLVIDRSDPSNPRIVGELDIASFAAADGVVEGTTAFLVSGDAGVAIVDLASLVSPQLMSIIDTPGIARGVAISGANEIAVADGRGAGVTFIEVIDRQRPVIKGSQRVAGNAVDIKVSGRTVYVATEQHLFIMLRP